MNREFYDPKFAFIRCFHYHLFFQKRYILISLLFVTVLGEKKINLEDIERDNVHEETKSSDDVADNRYNVKSEVDQYQGSTNLFGAKNTQTYKDLQSITDPKYAVSS